MDTQICSRCVMDTTDPAIVMDNDGICNACKAYEEARLTNGYRPGISEQKLNEIVEKMKQDGTGNQFDCILGLSGGVDSSYLAHVAIKLGLRVLAVHVDSGWNSEVSVRNIEKICRKLNIDLHTYVMDWPTMKELQRAYMLSGVANLDVPQDHLFFSAVMQVARQYNVKYMLNGYNIATEGAFTPFSAQHDMRDAWHMKSIYRKHGRGKSLSKYPFMSLWDSQMGMRNVMRVDLLNYIPFSKTKAIEELEKEYGWEYYGGKHFECRFTKYYQSVYLPVKFGYDKRKSHLSCLVMNGEMTREEALIELSQPPYDPVQMKADEAYIIERLEIDNDEWQRILHAPPTPNEAYFSQDALIRFAKRVLNKNMRKKIKESVDKATLKK